MSTQTQQVHATAKVLEENNNTTTTTVVFKAKPKKQYNKVQWAETVEDNEFKKMRTSKKCCIFHKKRPFGESDSEDSDCEDEHCAHHKHDEQTPAAENNQQQASS